MGHHHPFRAASWGVLAGVLLLGCAGNDETPAAAADPGNTSEADGCTPTFEGRGQLRQLELPDRNAAGELDLSGWDLSCTDLVGLDLSGADLSGANLRAAYIAGTLLAEANLSEATLSDANLSGADLSGADLRGADLTGAVVERAAFTWTRAIDLVGCPLDPTNKPISGAFAQCVPTGESFALIGRGMDVSGADLSDVDAGDLIGARAIDLRACPQLSGDSDYACLNQPATDGWALVGPSMSVLGADFSGVDLTGIKALDLADCPAKQSEGSRCTARPGPLPKFILLGPGVDLSGEKLREFDLLGADISGADLTDATLAFGNPTDVVLTGAKLDGLHATYLQGCPAELPTDWSCVRGSSTAGEQGGPFVLVGPGATLGICPHDYEADLSGADLAGLNLAGAQFDFAMLADANLSGADLSGAVLTSADLSNADLAGADLTDAMLGPGGCSGLGGANLTGAYLGNVVWSNTTCPDGTNSSDHEDTCAGFLEPAP